MLFANAINNVPVSTRTTNGMRALENTGSVLVDLFYKIGSARGEDLSRLFESAVQEDSALALRMLAWARDVRGGAGERSTFRKLLAYLCKHHPTLASKLIPHVPEYGRWDDLLEVVDFPGVISVIEAGLSNPDTAGLCAKWMPRKGDVAVKLTRGLGLTPRQYRKRLVSLTNVVESQMCSNDWTAINYEHVPSLASSRYQNAFERHDPTGYGSYKVKLEKGEAKINASSIFPHDVVKAAVCGDQRVALAQWEALPNYVENGSILPVVDVSWSMTAAIPNTNLQALDVALSLGLYLADKNQGEFKDVFCTFSTEPELLKLKGDLLAKIRQMNASKWQMSTNLHAVFNRILEVAVKGGVPQEHMPKYILILSDMQFNQCIQHDDSAIEMIRRKYREAGYEAPTVVFWNLTGGKTGNIPVKRNESGAMLVSGFSPAILTSILRCEDITPEGIMMKTIMNPRYDRVVG